MRKLFILIIFIGFLQFFVSGQISKYGNPFLKNYTSEDYNASGEQNWSIIRDLRGVMYFGNNDNGVLEYDGSTWRNIPIPNNSIVWSLAIDSSGVIYVGAVGEFGYLAPDEQGLMKYHSLSAGLDSTNREFADIYNTYTSGNKVYFCSRQKKFIWEKEDSIRVIDTDANSFWSFLVNGNLYMGNFTEGLMELRNNIFQKVTGGEFFIYKNIHSIKPYIENKVLISTSHSGIFIYDTLTGEVTPYPFSAPSEEFINLSFIYQNIPLPGDYFAFASVDNGVGIISEKGEILYHLTRQSGLRNEVCTNIFNFTDEDKNEPLWITTFDGITKVEINSPIRYFGEESGIEDAVMDIIRFKDVLYIATLSGVFFLDHETNGVPYFKQIEGAGTQPWSFLKFSVPDSSEDKLLVGTNQGLFEITKDNRAESIEEKIINNDNKARRYYVNRLYQSELNPSRIFLGCNDALVALSYKNQTWWHDYQLGQILQGPQIRSIAEENDGTIWLGTYLKGLIKIIPGQEDTTITRYNTTQTLPSLKDNQVYNFDGNLIFATAKGLYHYESGSDTFIPDSTFDQSYTDGSKGVFRITKDSENNYWMTVYTETLNGIEKVYLNDEGKYEIDSISFKRLPNVWTDAIYNDRDNITWFGISNILCSFDNQVQKNYDAPFNTLIRRVTTGQDLIIFNGANYTGNSDIGFQTALEQPEELKIELTYDNNNISFYYAAPFFEEESATKYSYYLDGYKEDDWSRWSDRTERVYTNLREGHYTFMVKAKNIYGNISEPASYEFHILPPWHRTIIAYVIYFVFSVLFIWGIVDFNTRRLQLEKIRLEGIVRERTAEVVRQKEEITDSIQYASRIQRALLPSQNLISESLEDHFTFFKPRDIVSGDFYWVSQKEDKTIVVAADCTGHGVPGAFMSMLGISFLNEIVNVTGIIKPDKILNALRGHVMKSLKQTGKEGETKDGMDLSLCVIDKKEKKVEFAGAYNSLYYVRPLTKDEIKEAKEGKEITLPKGVLRNDKYELNILKADNMPIGISVKEFDSFNSIELEIQKGYTLYLFSDGFVDQFGGPKGKKFLSKAFKRLLLDIQENSMEEQREILDKTLEEWKAYPDDDGKEHHQVDDIIIIGIRINKL